jgi:hypothetical protein
MNEVVSTFVYYPTHLNRKAAKIIQKSDEIFLLKHLLRVKKIINQGGIVSINEIGPSRFVFPTETTQSEKVVKRSLSCPSIINGAFRTPQNEKLKNKAFNFTPFLQEIKVDNRYDLTIKQLQTAQACGITLEGIKKLKNFYNDKVHCLNISSSPIFYSRHSNFNLPFSAVLIPNWCNKKGIYALLKTHTKLDSINFGTYNKVTWALNLKNFQMRVFRSAKLTNVPPNERRMNAILSQYPQYFVTGNMVFYKGKWRSRDSSSSLPVSQKVVKKIGFIMDYEGKDLWEILNDKTKPLDIETIKEIAQKYAETLAALHKLGIVHGDPKPENLFFKNRLIKIGDFGFATKRGEVRPGTGTPGYVAPEICLSINKILADPATDIWGMGCVFADLFQIEWTAWWEEVVEQDKWKLMTYQSLETSKDYFFPERKNPKHPHYIIDQCLQLKPEARPTASEVEVLWSSLKGKLSF